MTDHYAFVHCPYCGQKNIVGASNSPQVVICNDEEGGCGRYFAVTTSVKVTVKVYSMAEVEK